MKRVKMQDKSVNKFFHRTSVVLSPYLRNVTTEEKRQISHRLNKLECQRREQFVEILYNTRCYFNVRSKADISQLNLPHGNALTDLCVNHSRSRQQQQKTE